MKFEDFWGVPINCYIASSHPINQFHKVCSVEKPDRDNLIYHYLLSKTTGVVAKIAVDIETDEIVYIKNGG